MPAVMPRPIPPRKRSRIRGILFRLLLSLCSLLLVLGLLEVGLRLVHPAPLERIDPQIQHVYVPCDPAVGRFSDYYYMTPNQRGFHLSAAVSTNSLGIRDREVTEAKRPGALRILALGDSHTFGFGVDEAETWPRLLERKLTGHNRTFEVINAGVLAHSIEQEIQFLRDKLLHLKPDLVVLQYYWNDMPIPGEPLDAWPEGEEMIPASMRPRTAPKSTGEGPPQAAAGALNWFKAQAKKSYLVYYTVQKLPALQMAMHPTIETKWKRALLQGERSPRIDASWAFVEKKLIELKSLGDEQGFELLVVVIPLFEQMVSRSFKDARYQNVLQDIGRRNHFPVLDPLSAIVDSSPSYPRCFIPFDGHPNGIIYEIIASEVAAQVLKR